MSLPSESERRAADRPPSPPLPAGVEQFVRELFERLQQRGDRARRYQLKEEIGKGGMGRILLAHDEDLHRDVAMKVIREADDDTQAAARSSRIARFVEEAQVTGQLDHPGIVPVHELGLDSSGRVFFTMKRVRGEDLSHVLELARDGREGWNQARIVAVLLRVCEAMAYAHTKGVIHRDLKPSNIRIGRFGEVYVMDWGLARVLGRPDAWDLRVREPVEAVTRDVMSDRSAQRQSAASPLQTQAGTPIGTPMFMSPEQAMGEPDKLDRRTDVYALGAVLYSVLTGRMPYVNVATQVDAWTIVQWIRQGPPAPVSELAPRADPELTAICEKAMSRDPSARYADMLELAEELRAYLENRVVRAHRTGPVVELAKWVARNKMVAALAGLLVIATSGGGVGLALAESRRASEARRNLDEHLAADLVRRADRLGAIAPDNVARMQDWIRDAERLIGTRAALRTELEALGAGDGAPLLVAPHRDDLSSYAAAAANATYVRDRMQVVLGDARASLQEGRSHGLDSASALAVLPSEIETFAAAARTYEQLARWDTMPSFSDPARQRTCERDRSLLRDLDVLELDCLPRVRARLELARSMAVLPADESAAWSEAIRSIADVRECPRYQGLVMREQVGLVPLARNARSGLWEFWHVASGDRPEPDGNGGWSLHSGTGLVLVLLPGARARIGARDDDDSARLTEKPLREIELEPFFLSKYEMTQGQWLRLRGENPSEHASGADSLYDPRTTRVHPVEGVSWIESALSLELLGLLHPTEAQWEYAARAGTEARYVDGSAPADLRRRANYVDDCLRAVSEGFPATGDADGWALHAPVGSFPANAFGLHDMLGNVSEWCRDGYSDNEVPCEVSDGDGLRHPAFAPAKSTRGGSFKHGAAALRVSARAPRGARDRDDNLGVRPSRPLSP